MLTPRTRLFRRIAAATAFVFALASTPIAPAAAEMIPNSGVVASEETAMSPSEARDVVSGFLAREDVAAELEAMGVAPEEAQARVGALSDAEAVSVAQKIEDAPAGQGALGAIIGAGLIIFLVLLITDLLGFTKVFGFTEKGSANPA